MTAVVGAHWSTDYFPHRDGRDVEAPALTIALLGGLRVFVGSRAIEDSEWYLRKAKSLIKLLALADMHRLHRGEITEMLWPGLDQRAAANNLHKVLHVARRVLEPSLPGTAASSYLQFNGELVALTIADVWIDISEFHTAAQTARSSRDVSALRAALALYGGELLPEDRYDEWTIRPREEARHLYLTLLLEFADACSRCAEDDEARDALRQVIKMDPANEQAHVALMLLLAGSGQRQAALRQYAMLRDALLQELGAEPDAALQQLYSEILSGRYATKPATLPDPIVREATAPANNPIGRADVLARMRAHVDVLFAGRGSILLVHGDAGMGKSLLASHIEAEAARRGAISLWGAAYRDEHPVPYGPLAMALEVFAVRVAADTLATLADEYVTELARLVPSFSRALLVSRGAGQGVGAHTDERVLAALLHFFTRLSEHVPLVVTLEDLHLADADTMRFLDQLTRLVPKAQLLFLCTFRAEDVSVGSNLGRLIGAIGPGRAVEAIEIGPLERAQISELTVRLLGGPIDAAALDLIAELAQGSPYYAEEAVWGLRGRRRIEQVNGVWRIRAGVRVAWGRDDVRQLDHAVGDFQIARKLRTV